MDNLKINVMSEFKKGELVVFKTHPFINSFTNIKITCYSDYTSPVLVVKEVKEGSFDKVTGKNIGLQLNCLYYNSKDGKFIENWINSNLIQKIDFSILSHKILSNLDPKSYLESLKKELSIKNYEEIIRNYYINRKVVLKSVDIELNKVKVNRVKEDGKLTETNHLEFLPPIMTIIGHKFSDDKNKFCEKSGLPLIELKCKWYNSSSKNFSESYFSYEILYCVKEIQDLLPEKDLLSDIIESIGKNLYFILPLPLINQFQLEGDINKKIINTIGHSESILFKHYFYQMTYFDYVTQKSSIITIDDEFKEIDENVVFGRKFPSYNDKGYKLKISDCEFKKDNYYLIIYKDSFSSITKRTVRINDLFLYIKDFDELKKTYSSLNSWEPKNKPSSVNYEYFNGEISIFTDDNPIPPITLPKTIFDDENIEIILKTNCLLRKGKIRNFKLNRILEVQEIIEGRTIFGESTN